LDRIKAAAGGSRREIPDDFKYDKKKIKHIKHVLHNTTIALGTLVSALNEISRIKGPDISPDGLLGGLGYIMPIKDIKEKLNTSIRDLGDIADSLADELTNPKWDIKEDSDVKELIKEKEKVEEQAEESTGETPAESEAEAEPETEPEKAPEASISPDDVVTSTIDVVASDKLANAVKESLIQYFGHK
jgi:hypothetical protein